MSKIAFIVFFSFLLVAGSTQSQPPVSNDLNNLALVELVPVSESSNVIRTAPPQIREHHGNPVYFMQYIIAIPPVYV